MKPHKLFYLIAFSFGLIIMLVTPPFQPQDENCHFYRAYQVSSGTFSPVRQVQRLGGYFPESLHLFYDQFHPYVLTGYNKISPEELWDTRKISLNPDKKIFIDFTNTSLYPALLYFPQAAGIWTGRMAGLGPFWLLYLGRLFNLLFFILLTGLAIRIMPVKKWLLVILTALPMSHIVHSSQSGDLFVNALSYFVLAYILHLVFAGEGKKLGWRETGILLFCSVTLGVAKLVYTPILLLLLLIPAQRFRSRLARFGILAVLFVSGLGAAVIQKEIIDDRYIPYSEYHERYRDYTALKYGVDINKQIEHIKEQPVKTAGIFLHSYGREFKRMTHGYIGIPGWEHAYPPLWFVIFGYLFIFLYSMNRDRGDPVPVFRPRHRLVFGLIVITVTGMIMLSQYLSWNPVGSERAYPLIGRYFIPVFPLVFLMVSDFFGVNNRWVQKALTGTGVLIFGMLAGIMTLWLVITWSYTTNHYSEKLWSVDYSFKDNYPGSQELEYILSGADTVATFRLPGKDQITKNKFYTGEYSLKINKGQPYGMTVRITEGSAGDKLIVSFRSFGRGGYVNFQERPEGVNTWIFKAYPLRDSLGWKYQEAAFILPDDIEEELRVFLWWPQTDHVYADCYRLQYFEKD